MRGDRLKIAFMVSIGMNVGLATGLLALWLQPEKGVFKTASHSVAAYPSIEAAVSKMSGYSFARLVQELSDRTSLAAGYVKADAALAMLYSTYQVDIARVVSPSFLEKSLCKIDDLELVFFPKIGRQEMAAIQRFLEKEKWPFLEEKLFSLLKERRSDDPSLWETFRLMPAFVKIERLFHSLYPHFPEKEILELVLEGSFEDLKQISALTAEYRIDRALLQRALLHYALSGSFRALYLALQIAPEKLDLSLSHDQVIYLVSLIEAPSDHIERFLKHLIASPRPSEVKDAASAKIAKLWPHLADDFIKSNFLNLETRISSRTHKIEKGDTLWKIAKHYKVPIRQVAELNALDPSAHLKVGRFLKIPEQAADHFESSEG